MALRVRKDGSMWCASYSKPEQGDTYIDDTLHYQMSQVHGVICALRMPYHKVHPEWWWVGVAPKEADLTALPVPHQES